MNGTRILAVDDEYLIRWTLKKNLEKAGYVVFAAETGEEALRIIKEDAPDLALLDIKLPGIDGFELLEKALKIDQGLIPIMLTAQEEIDQVVKAMKLGAFDYISKPFDFKKVKLSVEKALAASQLKQEVKILRQEKKGRSGFSHIVATSPKMQNIIQITEKIA